MLCKHIHVERGIEITMFQTDLKVTGTITVYLGFERTNKKKIKLLEIELLLAIFNKLKTCYETYLHYKELLQM